jgi:hypothetical protein
MQREKGFVNSSQTITLWRNFNRKKYNTKLPPLLNLSKEFKSRCVVMPKSKLRIALKKWM